jgi:hypothetical protein
VPLASPVENTGLVQVEAAGVAATAAVVVVVGRVVDVVSGTTTDVVVVPSPLLAKVVVDVVDVHVWDLRKWMRWWRF